MVAAKFNAATGGGDMVTIDCPQGNQKGFEERAKTAIVMGRPQIVNDKVEELTLARLAKVAPEVGQAMPLQYASSPNSAPVICDQLDPASLRLFLEECRKYIRASETDKGSSAGGKGALSASADCGHMLYSHATVSIGIEYARAVCEFMLHKWAAEFQKVVTGEDGWGTDPAIMVFETSPHHPIRPALTKAFKVSASRVDDITRVHAKSTDPTKHAAPVNSRVAASLRELSKLDLKRQLLVIGSEWTELSATDGYDMKAVQQQLIEGAYKSGAAGLIMLCRLDGEFRARKAQSKKGNEVHHTAIPSLALMGLFNSWREVSFVGGVRPHNGQFWAIATGRREAQIVAPDAHFLSSSRNWTAFYAHFAPLMYRANVLKNLCVLYGIRLPRDEAMVEDGVQKLDCYTPLITSLEAWGLRVRKVAAITNALEVEVAELTDYYGAVEDAPAADVDV